ncbi:MAG: hypothetical protein Q9214_004230, partial [Letrouitia sp. 1 TL-2023]
NSSRSSPHDHERQKITHRQAEALCGFPKRTKQKRARMNQHHDGSRIEGLWRWEGLYKRGESLLRPDGCFLGRIPG